MTGGTRFGDEDEDDHVAACGYMLGKNDAALLTLAGRLLERAMLAPGIDWAIKVSVAKLMHVLSRLPNESAELNVEVTFSSPREHYGDEEVYFSLIVGVKEQVLRVRYGGHYYHPRTGGDSFSVFAWSAALSAEAGWIDYGESLGVVTRLVKPVDVLNAMPNALDRCEIHVFDDENPLIGDEAMQLPSLFANPAKRSSDESEGAEDSPDDDHGTDEDEDNPGLAVVINPVTTADRRLLERVGPINSGVTSAGDAYGIENCGGCGINLSTVGLFVDGASSQGTWGNYCAACCLSHGVPVGWGRGQLYARQPDGSWKGIAGFKR